eukprot:TRINITY_DN6755_c0_g1_i4.p1 TRINITY_DN6755_c0_g1~~TRINITY_DN6755_c0_g1_i4.p1  ORF type:complete len:298 (+),score=65.83 TRINITY_DN6755_c0_g1_i4:96-896(+)
MERKRRSSDSKANHSTQRSISNSPLTNECRKISTSISSVGKTVTRFITNHNAEIISTKTNVACSAKRKGIVLESSAGDEYRSSVIRKQSERILEIERHIMHLQKEFRWIKMRLMKRANGGNDKLAPWAIGFASTTSIMMGCIAVREELFRNIIDATRITSLVAIFTRCIMERSKGSNISIAKVLKRRVLSTIAVGAPFLFASRIMQHTEPIASSVGMISSVFASVVLMQMRPRLKIYCVLNIVAGILSLVMCIYAWVPSFRDLHFQ